MNKLKDLLLELEKRIELNLLEISNLKDYNDELSRKNQTLLIENNEAKDSFKSLEERFKALKIANTISGGENNINETRSEINSLIREVDLCISQLSD